MRSLWSLLAPGAPLCAQCGQPILGAVVHALGRTWHGHHLRCAVCAATLGASFRVSPQGEPFCAGHPDAVCEACGHAGPAGSVREGCCAPCATERLSSEGEAATLLAQVQAWLRQEGLPWWPQVFPVNQVASTGFERSGGPDTGPLVGQILTRLSVDGQGRPIREITGIRVLLGQPRLVFGAVLAHELGHAWVFQSGLQGLPATLEEGFCEWLSHGWLAASGDPRAPYLMARIASNPHPIYGEGYRLAARLAGSRGLPALVAALRAGREGLRG